MHFVAVPSYNACPSMCLRFFMAYDMRVHIVYPINRF